MADFPTISKLEDSKNFSENQQDPTITSEAEGGYVFRRARFTRIPRKTFTTGFTDITDADKATLQASYDTNMGGSEAMSYTHPTNATVYSVVYAEPMMFAYAGLGDRHRWNVTIKLEQV